MLSSRKLLAPHYQQTLLQRMRCEFVAEFTLSNKKRVSSRGNIQLHVEIEKYNRFSVAQNRFKSFGQPSFPNFLLTRDNVLSSTKRNYRHRVQFFSRVIWYNPY